MRTPLCLSMIVVMSLGCSDPDPATTPDTEVTPETTEETVAEVTPETTEETAAEVTPETTEDVETVEEVDALEEVDEIGEVGDTSAGSSFLMLQVSPLIDQTVADACYDVRVQAVGGAVEFSAGDPAFATTTADVDDPDNDAQVAAAIARGALCASAFGAGGANGEVSRIVACTPGVTYDTTVWVHNLYGPAGELGDTRWTNACPALGTLPGTDPADWQGGCTVRAKCPDDGSTLVTLDLALTRSPADGFFDIAVDFDDTFCSAKLETCYGGSADGTASGEFIKLLFGDDARVETVVVGFACASDEPFSLYMSDLVVRCETDASADVGWQPSFRSVVLPAEMPTGEHTGSVGDTIIDAAIYRGVEDLGAVNHMYQNFAIAVRNDAAADVPGGMPGNRNCRVTLRARGGKALGETTVGFESADGLGEISWAVRVTDDNAALDCRAAPLGSDDPNGEDYDVLHAPGDASFCTQISIDGDDTSATRSTVPHCH